MTPRRDTLSFVQLVPNLVTIMGMCAGLSAIRYTFDGRFELAAALIILAAILDGIDGLLARKLNAASSFGAELDSFSDFVSFGVAPGILVFGYALTGPMAGFGWVFVLVFAVCACLRLARFNISRTVADGASQRHFVGVPAPAGAMLGLLPVYAGLAGMVDPSRFPVLTAFYLAVVGLLMVSRLPTPSLKGIRIKREHAIWVLVGMSVFVGFLFLRTWFTLVVADLLYLGVLGSLALRHFRKQKAVE
ncbi:CDP-diacylglycerol--serine O-phosphatidyltransferase [Roseinatronobacter alkalisoli]|uniref:CDP-diacylglycerol--serine O-phosphatidyltransferase n=1 Tax=Roseinatronobacter alkalisoli TaxID=3028235 RepID=A0ABT5T9V7_9RHOB|nr:CDP-diacylglycerol--serine O-phosphatidyltransferase [Roseinatronobacter sp. HJB301]MDD7971909.1 CDP-diacylglycerol--serine O-phosphatidyltransferase [Roseinatronobacter sp. HJB301]